MVFDEDVEAHLGAVIRQAQQAVDDAAELVVPVPLRRGVDADGVAAEEFGGVGPLVVVLDRLLAFLLVGVAEPPLVVAHDQHAAHAEVVAALLHLGEVGLVGGLVLEELVDVLDGVDAEFLLRDFREVEVV